MGSRGHRHGTAVLVVALASVVAGVAVPAAAQDADDPAPGTTVPAPPTTASTPSPTTVPVPAGPPDGPGSSDVDADDPAPDGAETTPTTAAPLGEAAPAAEAHPAILVTTTRDVVDPHDSVLSLREAVILADEVPGADALRLAPGATYVLDRPCPDSPTREGPLTADLDHRSVDPLAIVGNGATIRQAAPDCRYGEARVLDVGGPLTLVALTITGGHSLAPCAGAAGIGGLTCQSYFGSSGPGGGVRAEGPTLLRAVTLRDNVAERSTGGGVWSYQGLRVEASTITGNEAWDGGGVGSGTAVVVDRSVVRGNVADTGIWGDGVGGGAYSWGSVTIDRSLVEANTGRVGAGAYAREELTVRRSTVVANRARPSWSGGDGRGIPPAVHRAVGGGLAALGRLDVRNATVTGNTVGGWVRTADGRERAYGEGGGLWAATGLGLTHVTVADNRADRGANLFVRQGTLRAFGSAVGATRRGAPPCHVGERSVSAGYNVVVGVRCGLGGGPGDRIEVRTLGLGPLGDHGGPTPTRVPAGAALGVIPPAACGRTTTDQRGVPRPQGRVCEAGAVEVP